MCACLCVCVCVCVCVQLLAAFSRLQRSQHPPDCSVLCHSFSHVFVLLLPHVFRHVFGGGIPARQDSHRDDGRRGVSPGRSGALRGEGHVEAAGAGLAAVLARPGLEPAVMRGAGGVRCNLWDAGRALCVYVCVCVCVFAYVLCARVLYVSV